jgi:hypothetical protein
MTSIRIQGLAELNGKLAKYGASIKPMIENTTKDAIIYVHSTMPAYPPQPALSLYRRTMTLWRSITSFVGPDSLSRVTTLFSSVVGIIGTALNYAQWVIDETSQTQAHKNNGWWTLQDVIKKAKPGIEKVYEKGVRDLTRKIF